MPLTDAYLDYAGIWQVALLARLEGRAVTRSAEDRLRRDVENASAVFAVARRGRHLFAVLSAFCLFAVG